MDSCICRLLFLLFAVMLLQKVNSMKKNANNINVPNINEAEIDEKLQQEFGPTLSAMILDFSEFENRLSKVVQEKMNLDPKMQKNTKIRIQNLMTKQKPSLHYQLVEEFIEYFADAENKKILQIWIDEAEAKVHEKTDSAVIKRIMSERRDEIRVSKFMGIKNKEFEQILGKLLDEKHNDSKWIRKIHPRYYYL